MFSLFHKNALLLLEDSSQPPQSLQAELSLWCIGLFSWWFWESLYIKENSPMSLIWVVKFPLPVVIFLQVLFTVVFTMQIFFLNVIKCIDFLKTAPGFYILRILFMLRKTSPTLRLFKKYFPRIFFSYFNGFVFMFKSLIDQWAPGFERTWTLEQWQARLECGCGQESEVSGSQRVCAGTARHQKDQSMSGEAVQREEPVFSSSALLLSPAWHLYPVAALKIIPFHDHRLPSPWFWKT